MSATILWMIAWLARGPVSASVPPIRTDGPDGAAPESALDSTSTPKPPTRETTALRLTMPFSSSPARSDQRLVHQGAYGEPYTARLSERQGQRHRTKHRRASRISPGPPMT